LRDCHCISEASVCRVIFIGKVCYRNHNINNNEPLRSDSRCLLPRAHSRLNNFLIHSTLSNNIPATTLQVTQHHNTFKHNDTNSNCFQQSVYSDPTTSSPVCLSIAPLSGKQMLGA